MSRLWVLARRLKPSRGVALLLASAALFGVGAASLSGVGARDLAELGVGGAIVALAAIAAFGG